MTGTSHPPTGGAVAEGVAKIRAVAAFLILGCFENEHSSDRSTCMLAEISLSTRKLLNWRQGHGLVTGP
jgi:hypothetical protein